MAKRIDTRVCICGGGPAGIMLGYLLARSGIDVVVLEKWGNFLRDFRGDTIHPSTLEVLHELGLLDGFLRLRHDKTRRLTGNVGGQPIALADFSHLHVQCPYIAFIPQWDFLDYLSGAAKKFEKFHLQMDTEATGLLEENGKIAGVRALHQGKEIEIRADLTVGADGRHSIIRKQAGLSVEVLGAPIDVLWFRLARHETAPEQSLGYADDGKFMVQVNRGDYWQCAFLIEKGSFDEMKTRGIAAFRADVAQIAPYFADSVDEIKDWEQVKLLTVEVDRLRTWHRPGLLMIGDAAHAMSPVAGVGINLAIQDAVAAANVLVPAFRNGLPTDGDLAAIQKRRQLPTRLTQGIQVLLHERVLRPILRSHGHLDPPWSVRLFNWFPALRRLPALLIGLGFRPEHVHV
jgi:2-polyprenyl-6-methoxyphenol hydroxylase-like FAD-dependent oxidoreductase